MSLPSHHLLVIQSKKDFQGRADKGPGCQIRMIRNNSRTSLTITNNYQTISKALLITPLPLQLIRTDDKTFKLQSCIQNYQNPLNDPRLFQSPNPHHQQSITNMDTCKITARIFHFVLYLDPLSPNFQVFSLGTLWARTC